MVFGLTQRQFLASLVAVGIGLSLGMPSHAQTNDVKNPAPLKAGLNKAVIDSFGSEQFWTFTVQPGHWQLRFVRSTPREGFSVGSRVGIGTVYAPKTPESTLTFKEDPVSVIYDGSVKQPTRVVVMIEPAKSPLVRQTNEYSLEASGSFDSNAAGAARNDASTPSVVGVYTISLNDIGVAKFAADGSIVSTNGGNGKWELFDAGTRTYVITIGGQRMTLTFQPGRGFVDKNDFLVIQVKPHA
jgi:hypothetical protein